MRLLNTETGQFVEIFKPSEVEYAILSHTWDPEGEQTFQDVRRIQSSIYFRTETVLVWVWLEVWWRSLLALSFLVIFLNRTLAYIKGPASSLSFLVGSSLRLAFSILPSSQPRVRLQQTAIQPPALYPTLLPLHTPPFTRNPQAFLARRLTASAKNVRARNSRWFSRRLSLKVREACFVAHKYGHRLIWIDSCCIDKTSSTELSEAINSMFTWYASATVCYAFLSDVKSPRFHNERLVKRSRIGESKWFTRGWTLQELIAPRTVIFLSRDWQFLGTKSSLSDVIEAATGISREILVQQLPLDQVSVATRMSWASKRRTTRVEDEAYSLMGIFDINMPTLYGEGRRAFIRLQEEILKRIPDQSVFAWGSLYHVGNLVSYDASGLTNTEISLQEQDASSSNIFAESPRSYAQCGDVCVLDHTTFARRLGVPDMGVPSYTSTPFGLRTRLPLLPVAHVLPPTVTDAPLPLPDNAYFVLFACELGNDLDADSGLIAAVCTVEDLDSSFSVMKALNLAVGSSPDGKAQPFHRLVSLSSTQVNRCREYLSTKVLYLPVTAPSALDTHHASKQLSFGVRLAPWSRALVEDAGYVVSYDDERPCRQCITLSGDAERIQIKLGAGWTDSRLQDGRHWTKVPLWITHAGDPVMGGPPAAHPTSTACTPMSSELWVGDPARNHTLFRFPGYLDAPLVLRISLSRLDHSGTFRWVELEVLPESLEDLNMTSPPRAHADLSLDGSV
ncbi:HET-domain-containing protein [Ganoderma leucocontextum]|nr:HET-domain-containing protein [Ganoderma leucocontextum]